MLRLTKAALSATKNGEFERVSLCNVKECVYMCLFFVPRNEITMDLC